MLTLAQLYNLGNSEGVDIFEYLALPEDSPLDKDLIINEIIIKCGQNFPMYADPYVMRSAVNIWSSKNQYTFIHLAKILTADYSPIENTDRYESITVDRDLTDNTDISNSKSDNLITSGSSAHTGTDTNTSETTTSAYNSSEYVPDEKTTNSLLHGETITDNGSSSRATNVTGSNDKTVDETTTTTQHTHGNIGVSTNTQLQVEEYGLLKDYNPYTFIAGLFENELTLCVY